MKVKKKRKEAEREGDASFITVSKCYLPAHSLLEDAFWGRRQLLSRDLPLQTLLKGTEGDREQTGWVRGGGGDLVFVLSAAWEMLSALFTHHWRVT